MLKRLTQQEGKIVLLLDIFMEGEQACFDGLDLIEIDNRPRHNITRIMKGPECVALDHPVKARRLILIMKFRNGALAVERCARDEHLLG